MAEVAEVPYRPREVKAADVGEVWQVHAKSNHRRVRSSGVPVMQTHQFFSSQASHHNETFLEIQERHNFYMYYFRTEYCPDFPVYKCDKAKPYTCTLAHYENHLRRCPVIVPNGSKPGNSDALRLKYSANLCVHASLLDCPQGSDCPYSHRVQKEHIYHPSVYKTQLCESTLNPNGDCTEYGRHCSKAHGPHDLRKPVLSDNTNAVPLMNEVSIQAITPKNFGVSGLEPVANNEEMYFLSPNSGRHSPPRSAPSLTRPKSNPFSAVPPLYNPSSSRAFSVHTSPALSGALSPGSASPASSPSSGANFQLSKVTPRSRLQSTFSQGAHKPQLIPIPLTSSESFADGTGGDDSSFHVDRSLALDSSSRGSFMMHGNGQRRDARPFGSISQNQSLPTSSVTRAPFGLDSASFGMPKVQPGYSVSSSLARSALPISTSSQTLSVTVTPSPSHATPVLLRPNSYPHVAPRDGKTMSDFVIGTSPGSSPSQHSKLVKPSLLYSHPHNDSPSTPPSQSHLSMCRRMGVASLVKVGASGDTDRDTSQFEKDDHRKYMYGFRVQTCKAFLESKCVNDSYTCFDAHSRLPRRRKPQLIHGRYNYIPTRCRYIMEDQECPQGAHCRFAHSTEEVIYHPSKYKTQLCSHPLAVDESGRSHCTGYGIHCAKAHGESDLRTPIFEEADDSGGTSTRQYTMEDFYTFVCPEIERVAERIFYMYYYKTEPCKGFPWNCQCNGFDYHRPEERRRGPDITYLPIACPNVKPYLNSEWGNPSLCEDPPSLPPGTLPHDQSHPRGPGGEKCEYAHTLLELMYHPQVYKTGLCDHFDEHDVSKWRCVWKRRCAHAHGRGDLRSKEEAMEEWRAHLAERGITSDYLSEQRVVPQPLPSPSLGFGDQSRLKTSSPFRAQVFPEASSDESHVLSDSQLPSFSSRANVSLPSDNRLPPTYPVVGMSSASLPIGSQPASSPANRQLDPPSIYMGSNSRGSALSVPLTSSPDISPAAIPSLPRAGSFPLWGTGSHSIGFDKVSPRAPPSGWPVRSSDLDSVKASDAGGTKFSPSLTSSSGRRSPVVVFARGARSSPFSSWSGLELEQNSTEPQFDLNLKSILETEYDIESDQSKDPKEIPGSGHVGPKDLAAASDPVFPNSAPKSTAYPPQSLRRLPSFLNLGFRLVSPWYSLATSSSEEYSTNLQDLTISLKLLLQKLHSQRRGSLPQDNDHRSQVMETILSFRTRIISALAFEFLRENPKGMSSIVLAFRVFDTPSQLSFALLKPVNSSGAPENESFSSILSYVLLGHRLALDAALLDDAEALLLSSFGPSAGAFAFDLLQSSLGAELTIEEAKCHPFFVGPLQMMDMIIAVASKIESASPMAESFLEAALHRSEFFRTWRSPVPSVVLLGCPKHQHPVRDFLVWLHQASDTCLKHSLGICSASQEFLDFLCFSHAQKNAHEALANLLYNKFSSAVLAVFHALKQHWKMWDPALFHRFFLPSLSKDYDGRPFTVQNQLTPDTSRTLLDISVSLVCPLSDSNAEGKSAVPHHLLDDPIVLSCCGKTVCRRCLGSFFSRLDSKQLMFGDASAPLGSSLCECGHCLSLEEKRALQESPANKILSDILDIFHHS